MVLNKAAVVWRKKKIKVLHKNFYKTKHTHATHDKIKHLTHFHCCYQSQKVKQIPHQVCWSLEAGPECYVEDFPTFSAHSHTFPHITWYLKPRLHTFICFRICFRIWFYSLCSFWINSAPLSVWKSGLLPFLLIFWARTMPLNFPITMWGFKHKILGSVRLISGPWTEKFPF